MKAFQVASTVLAIASASVFAVQEIEIAEYGADVGQAHFGDFKLTMDNDVSFTLLSRLKVLTRQ